MSLNLSKVANFVTSKVKTSEINENNYVSTENMLPNKAGLTKASSLPVTKSVREYSEEDVLISNIRPYFKKIWFADKNGGCSNDVLVLRANENYNPQFLYYVLSSNDFFDYVMSTAKGTKMPRGDKKAMVNYEVPDFSLETQNKISAILSTIDYKINVNNQINHNLEEIAKSIFKEWFIDFNIFENIQFKSSELGEIPINCTIKSLSDISKEIVCGKTPSTKIKEYWGLDIPFLTIPDMHNKVYVINTERYLSKKGSKSQLKKLLPPNAICVSCIATAGLVTLTSNHCHTNQQINSIICKDYISPYFIYLSLSNMSKYIETLGSSGSTTINLNKKEFSKINIIVPPIKLMKRFNHYMESLFNKIKDNYKENVKLMKLRDILLPKLMSGEIDVSQIEI